MTHVITSFLIFYEFGKIMWVPRNSIIQPSIYYPESWYFFGVLVGSPPRLSLLYPSSTTNEDHAFHIQKTLRSITHLLCMCQWRSYLDDHNDPICISYIGIHWVVWLYWQVLNHWWYHGNRVAWTICKSCNMSNSFFQKF